MSRVLVIAFCATLPACSSRAVEASEPTKLQIDFGIVRDATTPRLETVRIENTSATTWEVAELVPSCACVGIVSFSKRVAPGDALEVRFGLELSGMRGTVEQSVGASLVDGRAFPIFDVSALVVPEPYATPESVAVRADGTPTPGTITLTTPWPEARWSLSSSPQAIAVRERARRTSHGAQIIELELALAPTRASASDGPPAASDSIRLQVGDGASAESFELSVPVVQPMATTAVLFRNKVLTVPAHGVPDTQLRVALGRALDATEVQSADVSVDPPGYWGAELRADALLLRRDVAAIELPVSVRVAIPERVPETLSIRTVSQPRQ